MSAAAVGRPGEAPATGVHFLDEFQSAALHPVYGPCSGVGWESPLGSSTLASRRGTIGGWSSRPFRDDLGPVHQAAVVGCSLAIGRVILGSWIRVGPRRWPGVGHQATQAAGEVGQVGPRARLPRLGVHPGTPTDGVVPACARFATRERCVSVQGQQRALEVSSYQTAGRCCTGCPRWERPGGEPPLAGWRSTRRQRRRGPGLRGGGQKGRVPGRGVGLRSYWPAADALRRGVAPFPRATTA